MLWLREKQGYTHTVPLCNSDIGRSQALYDSNWFSVQSNVGDQLKNMASSESIAANYGDVKRIPKTNGGPVRAQSHEANEWLSLRRKPTGGDS